MPGLTGVTAISAGAYHVCALRSDGTVDCWGSNPYGALGTGDTNTNDYSVAAPAPVLSLTSVKAIASGNDFTCASQSGAVEC